MPSSINLLYNVSCDLFVDLTFRFDWAEIIGKLNI